MRWKMEGPVGSSSSNYRRARESVSEGTQGGSSYQGDNVIQHMSLTNRHPHKSGVICIHDVDVKMVCGC